VLAASAPHGSPDGQPDAPLMRPVDWLLCDVIAEPQRSIALVSRWLEEGLARNLVVTVKFKGETEFGQLAGLPALFARLQPTFARIKQLAHNKNEVTVMVRR